MDQQTENTMAVDSIQPVDTSLNGSHSFPEATIEELERELPVVYDDQVPLGELLSRVVQAIYAELSELAETLPNMSDAARKRTLADWVVKTKKQVVKLYAVAKWARDAKTVQKCMNITSFLMTQNQQFEDAMRGLNYAKESLDPARLRNHDLLTSLDVLTTGSYLRLPTCIKKMIIPPTPLTDADVKETLSNMEDVIRYRLRMSEIVPVEMARYRIADGRVHFTVPHLFETSLCLRGAEPGEGWFFVNVEFLITIGGDVTGLQEFPRAPTGIIKRHITDEADARLAFYLPLPEEPAPPAGVEIPSRPHLPEGVVDTPLVRLYNFLQMMSLSYQLEILWYQAERIRSLGWGEYLAIQMSKDRKTMTASYWIRPPVLQPQNRQRFKIPLLGGTLTISIVESPAPPQAGPGPARSARARAMSRIQQKSKLGGGRPSDEVEGLKSSVRWQPEPNALGVLLQSEDVFMPENGLQVDPDNLDFEAMLRVVLDKHTKAILLGLQRQLQYGPTKSVFSAPGVVSVVQEGGIHALRVHLCADEVVIITVDARTGRINLRDTGDLAAAGRGPRFSAISEKLNENPTILLEALVRLRIHTITDLAEQKANYLGLQSYRRRNFQQEEMIKLGQFARGTLYIQLSSFPNNYLVLVITDGGFRYALISTKVLTDSMYGNMVMEDIAWLNFERIHGEDIVITAETIDHKIGVKRKRDSVESVNVFQEDNDPTGFNLDTQVLRELYSYCCARVAYMNVERQFKRQGIPFTYVNPTSGLAMSTELAHLQSSLARSVPALCVQSKDILAGAPAAEAAMPNIRVIPLNWWSERKAQVVTCVKLKYVQQPMGKTASSSAVIRPSKRIIYDTTEAIVSFLSENVDTCVGEFLEEWARVSKMVVIAREVSQMSKKWPDVRLISFDLQTVEFVYASNCTVSISCQDQISLSGGNFDLRFSRCRPYNDADMDEENVFNPHDDAEPFFRNILRHHGLAPSLHRLVTLLRDTLPIALELEDMRLYSEKTGQNVDTFPKAAGWYRLLYSDLRHALDFRLMSGQRVAIIDGSHSLFDGPLQPSDPAYTELGLQPIDNFRELVLEVIKDMLASGKLVLGTAAAIDVGVICNVSCVRLVGRAIHSKVLERLKT
ncbi:mediator complex subunit MED14-domain-containing protein [Crucibulum laeve]|uniref:Mediator of RNA polymerase II transcription subunit 14 n=1 Tax=Crucibulum laeve TaxID=68775 RepID=A0A5C3MHV8_9AGAR|nr:mediator complex subunit MED14-domain-containing protein [Crucibulum laeve]